MFSHQKTHLQRLNLDKLLDKQIVHHSIKKGQLYHIGIYEDGSR